MDQERLDHRGFLRSLSMEQRSSLTRKSDREGLLALSWHGGAILATGALIVAEVPGWPLLLPLQGVLIVFLFTLLHETVHRTVFETLWLNDVVARVSGFLIGLPSDWFRYFHFAHHRHTHDPERDPELAAPKPATLGQYLAHVSGLPVWWSQAKTLIRNALGRCDDEFVPVARLPRVRKEAQLQLLAYAALAGLSLASGSTLLLFAWVIPILLGQPVLRLYLMAEHGRCPHVDNMFENSRTTFTNALVRRLAWNMPYHAEHHAFPAVPFYRLPELHALTRSHLTVTEPGYLAFHRGYLADLAH